MQFYKYPTATLFAIFATALAVGCKTKRADVIAITPVDTVYSPYKLAAFFAYPVNERQPRLVNTGDAVADSAAYKLRLQHWTLLFDTRNYTKKYGPLPYFYPDNFTLDEYKKHPKPVPSEYNSIMFGD